MTAFRPLRDPLLTGLVRGLAAFCGELEWRQAQAFGRGLGRLAWPLARRDRRRTLAHLAIAFPARSVDERRRLGRANFAHLGTTLGECLYLLRHDAAEVDRHVDLTGWEHVVQAAASGRPLLVLTGHCGNWELINALYARRGRPITAIARHLPEAGLDHLLVGFRSRLGTRTIRRGSPGAARDMLRTLRGGATLGMLIDQDTQVDGVWVPFFGRPAFTPVGAAELALRFEARVLPTFIARRPDGRHQARVEAALELPRDPCAATATMSERIEAQIREVPEQWVWLHRRWRRQPTPGVSPPTL